MSQKNKMPEVERRDFLYAAAAAAAGGVCFSSATIRQALAAARQSGKPLFTAANFNALLPKQHDEKFRGLMQEVRADVRAFIRRQFYLTKEQERELASLSQETVRKIQESADYILKNKATFELSIVRSEDRGETRDVLAGQYSTSTSGLFSSTCSTAAYGMYCSGTYKTSKG